MRWAELSPFSCIGRNFVSHMCAQGEFVYELVGEALLPVPSLEARGVVPLEGPNFTYDLLIPLQNNQVCVSCSWGLPPKIFKTAQRQHGTHSRGKACNEGLSHYFAAFTCSHTYHTTHCSCYCRLFCSLRLPNAHSWTDTLWQRIGLRQPFLKWMPSRG